MKVVVRFWDSAWGMGLWEGIAVYSGILAILAALAQMGWIGLVPAALFGFAGGLDIGCSIRHAYRESKEEELWSTSARAPGTGTRN